MRLYESVIIFDPQLKAPEIEESVKKFTNFVANHGGELVKQDDWGKRRLAFEINRKQYGYYVLLRFHGQGQLVALLEREYKLNEMVLRYLTIQVEKKALKMEQQLAGEAEKTEAEAKAPRVEAPAEEPAVEETSAEEISEDDTTAEETPVEEDSEGDTAAEETEDAAATESEPGDDEKKND